MKPFIVFYIVWTYVDYIVWPHLCMKHRWVWGFSGFGVKRCVPGVTLSTTECFGNDPEARWLFHKGARCVHWYMVNSWWCFTRIQLYDNIYIYGYMYVCIYIYMANDGKWWVLVNDGWWIMIIRQAGKFPSLTGIPQMYKPFYHYSPLHPMIPQVTPIQIPV